VTSLFFILSLAALAVLIAFLTLLSTAIDALASNKAGNTDDQSRPAVDQDEHHHPVATAIETYRQERRAGERNRAERDVITIKVLTATGGFALIAAGAAVYSAILLTKQIGDFEDQERRQLRPYVGIPPTYALVCKKCDKTMGLPPPSNVQVGMKNAINIDITKYGLTPLIILSAASDLESGKVMRLSALLDLITG
jgi:hypothetical protein